jgi:DNA-binding NarL/FixJ family response regulator
VRPVIVCVRASIPVAGSILITLVDPGVVQIMITIVLLNSQSSMRAVLRLRLELEADLIVTGDARIGEEALAQVVALAPDVIILDATMPFLDQAEATHQISSFTRISSVILLSLYDDPLTRAHAIAAGAVAVVSKHASDDVLLAAIRSAASSSSATASD